MKAYPIADVFPLMPGDELKTLASDIQTNGLRLPITLYEGKILDGRNRYQACQIAEVEPTTATFQGGSALEFVISLNLHRRHLNQSQRAMVAARLATMPAGFRSDKPSANLREVVSQSAAAKLLNVSQRSLQTAKTILRDAPDEVAAIESGEKNLSQVRREVKRAAVLANVQLPSGKFRVVYADPPWKYNDKCEDGSIQSGGAEAHYPSMSITELCAMPVAELADENAVLFLWVTAPLLFECAPIIEAWSFKYKTNFSWWKMAHNMGHYSSVQHEHLLLCTRGSCLPDVRKLEPSVPSIKRTRHSEKPVAFREMIDRLYPHGNRLELFARTETEGWETYGNHLFEYGIQHEKGGGV